eukprot:12914131-Prorocentrum_lima.AAC.1
MDNINRNFKALVLSNDLPAIQECAMDYILGLPTRFTDLHQVKAESTASSALAIKGLEERMKNFSLFGEIGHC